MQKKESTIFVPEIEAKFLLERREQLDEVLDTLAQLGHTVTRGPTQSIVDRYFDTTDWLVFRAGFACRLRENGDRLKLTLKELCSGGGPVFEREEIEQTLLSGQRSDAGLPPGPVQARLEPIINGHPRRELFRLKNKRTLYRVTTSGKSPATMELAVDRAEVVPNGTERQPCSFVELELELKEGDSKNLEEIALVLSERVGLLSAQLSKFERGLQAAGIESPEEKDVAATAALGRRSSMLDLAYVHLSRQFKHLRLEQLRAWEGIDPEGVHQMRITIRRLRGALRVFRPLLSTRDARHFNGEFRWLARALGAVRDADVYRENFLTYLSKLDESDVRALESYEAHLQGVQQAARERLLEVLESDRYRQLLADFERFVTAGPSIGRRRRFGTLTIDYGAGIYVAAALDEMRERGRRIKRRSPEAKLHRLRIRAKRVRYLMEFFVEFYADKLKEPLKACKRLQNVLGEHQDAAVACKRLRAYAASLGPPAAEGERAALDRLVQSQSQHAIEARARFSRTRRRFEKSIERV